MTTAKKHIIKSQLTESDVRNICITYNLYTRGDSEAYGKMLDRVTEIDMFTFDENGEQLHDSWNSDAYVEIASDIAEHSTVEDLEGDEKMEYVAHLLMKGTYRWIRTYYKGYDY